MTSVLDGVRPSPGAATLEGRLVWIFQVRPKCLHCCARGRAHSDAGLFKQALSHYGLVIGNEFHAAGTRGCVKSVGVKYGNDQIFDMENFDDCLLYTSDA